MYYLVLSTLGFDSSRQFLWKYEHCTLERKKKEKKKKNQQQQQQKTKKQNITQPIYKYIYTSWVHIIRASKATT